MKAKQYAIIAGMLMIAGSINSCTNSGMGRTFGSAMDRDDFRDSETWGKVVSEEVSVGTFSGISLDGAADVDFYQDNDVSVVITGNKKAVAMYEVSVEGDLLTVKMKDGKKNARVPEVLVEVHAPTLWKVKNSGAGDVELKKTVTLEGDLLVDASGAGDVDADVLKCHKLEVNQSGAGDVDVDKIKCNTIKIASTGAGDVDVAGKAKKVDAKVNGTGDASLKIDRCAEISVTAEGAGDIDLKVNCDVLNIKVNGTGTVEAKGKCHTLTKQSDGLAKIHTRELRAASVSIKD